MKIRWSEHMPASEHHPAHMRAFQYKVTHELINEIHDQVIHPTAPGRSFFMIILDHLRGLSMVEEAPYDGRGSRYVEPYELEWCFIDLGLQYKEAISVADYSALMLMLDEAANARS